VNGWVLAELAVAALAVSVVVAAAAGRWLARLREGREAAGEHPVSHPVFHPAPLEPPPGFTSRVWLVAGARVVHDEYGVGKVVAVSLTLPGADVGVLFDDGPGRWVPPSRLDPITPADERLLARMRAAAVRLPQQHPREDQP